MTDNKLNVKLKFLKVLEILQRTDEEHPMNASQIGRVLEEEFGIISERKSISRDIDTLKKSGFEITLKTDKRKGWFMLEHRYPNWVVRFFIDSVNSSRFFSYSVAQDIINSLKKELSEHERTNYEATLPLNKGTMRKCDTSVSSYIDLVLGAINDNIKIQFQYYHMDKRFIKVARLDENNNAKLYVVSPYSFYLNNNFYYMLAVLEGENIFRSFRLDRMSRVKLTDKPREDIKKLMGTTPRKAIDTFLKREIYMFSSSKSATLYLRCKSSVADLIVDKFNPSRPYNVFEGGFDVQIDTSENDGVYYWLLSVSPNVELLKSDPPHIKEKFVGMLKEASSYYNN